MTLRVAVIGARRVRQGTGEFVARQLADQGCAVPAIVGTSAASLEVALRGLRERQRLECRGYTSLAALLEREQVDAVAICSPHEAHAADLELALEARLHVFCEKPLWWTKGLERATRAQVEAQVARLVDRCAENGKVLHLNAQWPYTLDAFHELHPEARGVRPRELRMWLSPMTQGLDAVVDAGSHLISMLHACLGFGELERPRVTFVDADRVLVEATYAHATGTTRAELRLARCMEPPRPAGYALDGRAVERRIELPSYRFSFEDGGRTVPVRDPLTSSVEDFVRSTATGRPLDRTSLVLGMVQLQALAAASQSGAS